MGLLSSRRRALADGLAEAGELLAVEAIDRTGLVVTSEGALVRVINVIPPNPLILSSDGREQIAAGYCHLISRLRPEQGLQFYVEARPVNLEELLGASRREVQAFAGEPPIGERLARDDLALSRWRLYGAMEESLRLHADEQAAVDLNTYVVVPYVPSHRTAGSLLKQLRARARRRASAPLERDLSAHRRAVRESLSHTDAIRAELDALSLPTRLLNGEEVVRLLYGRFNPTLSDAGRIPNSSTEILGELDTVQQAKEARQVAQRLRALIAQSGVDFRRSRLYVEIDRDLEQTIYPASTADATHFGWLMGAMMIRQPFTLSVHIEALDRRRERQRLKMSYRRIFAINRGAEARGRVPDFDRYAQEAESERLLAEMAGHERANLFRVSIYPSIRARGPEPDAAALSESVDYCAEQIQSASDCRMDRGEFQQRELWPSTLPLGRNPAATDVNRRRRTRRARKYATRNAADAVPLIGSACGSPQGIPFAFSDPGRTLERIDPFDRAHPNATTLISGRSGSGKTLTGNLLVARAVSQGAVGYVLDRAGHYETLTRLIDGARHIEMGADDSPHAINPWDVPDAAEVSLEKVAFLVSLHAVMMGDEGLSTLERSQLGVAIRNVYAQAAQLCSAPRESMLRDELLTRSKLELDAGAAEIAAVLRNLAERLGEFCGEGSYAYLMDRETTVGPDAPLVVFDTRRVPEVVLKPVIFATVEFITRAIELRRDTHRADAARPGAPKWTGKSLLLLDEAWRLVGKETGEYANDLARRARHRGMWLICLSQGLSDFSTEHGLALLRNSTIQLLLAQHPDEIPFIKQALRLSDEEAALLGRLKTVKGSHSQCLWINGERGRGQVAIRLGPTEYWAFTSDPTRDVPLREAKIVEHDGDVWPAIADLARGTSTRNLDAQAA